MKAEENIEKLFEGEDLPEATPEEKAIPLIKLDDAEPDGIERRQFSRADIADRKLELKFTNGSQFARQYIENISLGGVFVKTDEKRNMGDILPIEFTVPMKGEARHFQMLGKVCRVTADGVGLEFINTTNEIRQELEAFVKSVLPKNISTLTKPKASTIEVLKRIREEKTLKLESTKSTYRKISIIVVLLILNIYLVSETVRDQIAYSSFKNQSLHIGGKDVPLAAVRSLEKDKKGNWIIRLSDKNQIQVKESELERQLPGYLHSTMQILKSTPVRKEIRRSKNTRGLSDLH